jgi:hypothetical protein
MANEWGFIAIVACLLPVAVIHTFDGIRRVATGGFTKAPTASLAYGILIFLALGALAWGQYYIATLKIEILESKLTPKLATAPTHNLSPQQRIEFDRLRAKFAYQESGELLPFQDGLGMSVLYAPSQEEILNREQLVAGTAQVELLARERLGDAAKISLAALISALLGWHFSRRADTELLPTAD